MILQFRGQGHVGQLEAHLVVALAGGPVAYRVRPGLLGHVHLGLGNQRPGNGGAQQILPLIQGVGPEDGEDKIPGKLFPQVFDIHLGRAGGHGLDPHFVQFFPLPQISGKGHHRTLIGLHEPLENDRGIQPAGVGQDDFVDICHNSYLSFIIRYHIVP